MEKDGVTQAVALEHSEQGDRDLEAIKGQTRVKTFDKISGWQSIKENPYAISWCLYMLFTCIMYGYDGMAGTIVISLPHWRQDYGYLYEGQYVVSAEWQLGFTAASLLGVAFGGILTGIFAPLVGHKGCILGAYTLTVGGVFAQWYSPGDMPLFLAGKLLTGIPLGVFLTIAPVYCSEVAPSSLRGAMIASVNWAQVIGQLMGYGVMRETQLIDSSMSYRIMYAVQWGFAGLGFVILPFVPESPIRLAARGKLEAARKSLARLYPNINLEERIQEIQELLVVDAAAAGKGGRLKDCFNKKNRLRTLVALSVFFFQANSGVSWVLGYMGYFFQLSGMNAQVVFDTTVGIAGVMAVGNMVGWVLIEKLGRRNLILYGLMICTASLMIIGILGQFLNSGSSIVLAQAAFMAMWAFAYQGSIGAAGYSLVSEVPTSSLRGPTQAMATIVSGVSFGSWGLVMPFMINPDEGNMGGNVAFVFFGFSVISLICIFFYYPETKNRSFEEIDALFERGVKPRHFSKTRLN